MLSAFTQCPFKILLEFFNSRVCLSASSETRFKTTQNFKNTQFLFYFDLTNITILFVVVDDKFHMLKFTHVANAIVGTCFWQITACFAFFFFFKIRKNAFSFVSFRTNKILSSMSSFRHRSYFCCKMSAKPFSTLHFFLQLFRTSRLFLNTKMQAWFCQKIFFTNYPFCCL